jgi:hypothetical protein
MSVSNGLKVPPVAPPKAPLFPAESNSACVLPGGLRRVSESSAVSATGVSGSFSQRASVDRPATPCAARSIRIIEVELLQNPAYEDALNMLRPVVGDLLSVLSADFKGHVDTRLAATLLDMQVAPLLKGIATLDPQADHIAMTELVQTYLKSLGATQLEALARGISVSRQDGLLKGYSQITSNMHALVQVSLAARTTNAA